MTRRPPTSKAKGPTKAAPRKRVEAKPEKSTAKPTTDFSAERLRVGTWPAVEGKPELETPEKPSAPPEDAPRDDKSPLETRDEAEGEAVVVEDAAAPVVRQEFPMVSPDEQALLRAQHNL